MNDQGRTRAFVAVLLPDKLRKQLGEIIHPLRASETNVRWVSEDNLHLTLKFLGEISPTTLESAGEVLREVASRHSPLEVEMIGWGTFPSARQPRVVWAGISGGADELKALSGDIEKSLERLGFDNEDRFKAHVTLGRVKRPCDMAVISRQMDICRGGIGVFPVNEIHLMESVLSSGGPTYRSLEHVSLGGETRG